MKLEIANKAEFEMTNKNSAFKPLAANHLASYANRTLCKWSSMGLFLVLIFCILGLNSVFAQYGQENINFTQGHVNENATVSVSVPLGKYGGHGTSLPISLSYSSSQWRVDHMKTVRNFAVAPPYYIRQSVTKAIFSEFATSGWKSSLDLPTIEFPKADEKYDYRGRQSTASTSGDGCFGFRIAKVFIHMPDGSTHELRKSDYPYSTPNVDMTGTFYAVDGSRMRFDANGTPDTGTLYLPDGTRYIIAHPTSQIIDKDGNVMTFNESTRQWTDTLGRVIGIPLPANPSAGDYVYSLPGMGSGTINYTLKWRTLANALTPDANNQTPALRVVADKYLPFPGSDPTDSNQNNYPQAQTTSALFASTMPPEQDPPDPYPVSTLMVAKDYSAGQVFNPVVLTEVVLPNGTSYKFSYSVYGEIDKVTYPTGAYEKYIYNPIPADPTVGDQYTQADHRIISRKLSIKGDGTDILEWKYTGDGQGAQRIISPDNTAVNINKYHAIVPIDNQGRQYWPFGLSDSRETYTKETRNYSSSPDGLGGTIMRRGLSDYSQTTNTYTFTTVCGSVTFSKTINATRNPMLLKSVGIVFEGAGSALASTSTYAYDVTNQYTTGVDQNFAFNYNYAVVDNATAQTGAIASIPFGPYENSVETFYVTDPAYRNLNILGLPTITQTKNPAGTVVAKSEVVYDEAAYPTLNYGAAGGWQDPGTTARAHITTTKSWFDIAGNQFIATHNQYDQFGNPRKSWDGKGNLSEVEYSPTYQYAYATKAKTPAPDPSGANGSSVPYESNTTYDFNTGLALTVTDANGQIETIQYNDPLLRPTRVIPPAGGSTSETIYNDAPGNMWVKSRVQLDATNWKEAVSYMDNAGRNIKSQSIQSDGDVYSETVYDNMGRVKQTTNPYRAGDTKQWTTSNYDDLGRVVQIITPDGASATSAFGLSLSVKIGVTKTLTDQAGKKRQGISDGLGRMIRVIEDPNGQNLATDYVFDTMGSLRQTVQGIQNRYFMYDALGRLLRARQPEQNANAAFNLTDPVTGNNQWSIAYSYDANSNITNTTDALGVGINGTYDNLNRLILRDYSDTTPDVSFRYDDPAISYSKGKLTKVSSSVSEIRYTQFNNLGRVLASQQITSGQTYNFGYSYNLAGTLISEIYPDGSMVSNQFQADGDLAQVNGQNGSVNKVYADNMIYATSGVLTSMRLGNNRFENAQLNNRLQVTQIGLGVTPNDSVIMQLNYDYGTTDNNGSLKAQQIAVPTTGSTQGFLAVQSYSYDSLNRIQSAQEAISNQLTWKQTFSYDRYGNRRFDAANTTTLGSCGQSFCNPTIDTANNRFTTGQGYTYDSNGNLVNDSFGRTFIYDAESHQKEVRDSSNQVIGQYFYDGDGKRVKKVTTLESTVFVYDAGGSLVIEYTIPGSGSTYVQTTQYLTQDSLGSPRVITDQAGNVTSRHDYMAFGDEAASAQRVSGLGYTPDNIRQQYTGYQTDGESGLDFAQARYYNAKHGRFTSVDPLTASANLKNPQTLNRYSYVINSPYKFTDTLGLFPAGGGACGRNRCISIPDNHWWLDNAAYEVDVQKQEQTQAQQPNQPAQPTQPGENPVQKVPFKKIGEVKIGDKIIPIYAPQNTSKKTANAVIKNVREAVDLINSTVEAGTTQAEMALSSVDLQNITSLNTLVYVPVGSVNFSPIGIPGVNSSGKSTWSDGQQNIDTGAWFASALLSETPDVLIPALGHEGKHQTDFQRDPSAWDKESESKAGRDAREVRAYTYELDFYIRFNNKNPKNPDSHMKWLQDNINNPYQGPNKKP